MNIGKRHCIFDLDGTLTNPTEGIYKSVLYALSELGVPLPTEESVKRQIGPPLAEIFPKLIPGIDAVGLERAIKSYRKRYSELGLFENEVYPGIFELLETLSKEATLTVATSKPEVFAKRILEKFCLIHFFDEVFGPTLDSRVDEKALLIGKAVSRVGAPLALTTMVGDRKFDVSGAKANGIRCIGVLWGFGNSDELNEAGAFKLIKYPEELSTLLLTE